MPFSMFMRLDVIHSVRYCELLSSTTRQFIEVKEMYFHEPINSETICLRQIAKLMTTLK